MVAMLQAGLCSREGYLMNSNRYSLSALAILLIGFKTLSFSNGGVDHSLFDKVLHKYVVNGLVDYAGLKKDKSFEKYLSLLSETNFSDIPNEKARLVYWINAYNAFTLKLIVDHYPVKSIRDIEKDGKGPWDIAWIRIGKQMLSLNNIENDIIREEYAEPLVHMALVCAAISCPPLRSEAYTPEKLFAQLKENTKAFFRDPLKNRYDEKTNTIYLSELLNWYGSDFDDRYGSGEKFGMMELGVDPMKKPGVKYLPYDWSLNAQK